MIGNFKEKRIRNPEHLKFLRSLSCCNPNHHALIEREFKKGVPINRRKEAHHETKPMQGSKGVKVGDNQALTLCAHCHAERHRIGRKAFWGEYDPIVIAHSLYRIKIDFNVLDRQDKARKTIRKWMINCRKKQT